MMKLVHVDESGNQDQSDVFTMAGVMIDAMDFGGWAPKFDRKISGMLAKHRGQRVSNLKAKRFIEGKDEWDRYVPKNSRMKFFRDLCTLVTQCGTVYAYGMSFKGFAEARKKVANLPKYQGYYWIATSMFITCLIQKKMQQESRVTGGTVLIFDNNNLIPTLSGRIFEPSAWYDSLYAQPYKVGSQTRWRVSRENRLDRIVNGGYAISSEDSFLIQTADVLSYIYRRHLELESGESPNYPDEPTNYKELVGILEPKRELIGQYPSTRPKGKMTAVKFYELAKHSHWAL